jgi:cytochrome P450
MDDIQLRNQVITLLLAGYETTANALTWTLYLIASHPEIEKQLSETVFESGADSAKLTQDIFHEALRLYPPAWVLGRKALSADQLDGYHIAPGTVIAISPYAVHRNPDYWAEPDAFIPERFSHGNGFHGPTSPFLPFGRGPRQCIGKDMALLEANMIVPAILRRYRLKLVPGQDIRPEAAFIMRPDGPVWMQPTLR